MEKLTRREEREYAFTMLFEALFHADEACGELYESILENTDDERIRQSRYVKKLFFGVSEKLEEISAAINANLKGWKAERISKVSLAILRLAVYEMLFIDKLAPQISINEAVELCKKYDDEKAPAFVNGVLRGVFRSLPENAEDGQ